jgi:monovalent cation/hydrogen antiporter
VIVAGVVIGAWRSKITTAQTRLQLHSVYQTVIFVLESVVFALPGLELPTLVRDLGHAGRWPVAALAVTGTLVATRVAWVFPVLAISGWRHGKRRPSWPAPAVVSWAGTRGVVPLAAALSIPLTTSDGSALPQRDLVLVLAAATIVISLIVQGFTLEPLARLAGFSPAGAGPAHEGAIARLRMVEAGLARLDELAEDGAAPDEMIDRLRTSLQARIETTRARMDHGPDTGRPALTERELRADLIAAESAELSRLYDAGTIGAATHQRLQRNLDLETARLAEPPQ